MNDENLLLAAKYIRADIAIYLFDGELLLEHITLVIVVFLRVYIRGIYRLLLYESLYGFYLLRHCRYRAVCHLGIHAGLP